MKIANLCILPLSIRYRNQQDDSKVTECSLKVLSCKVFMLFEVYIDIRLEIVLDF